MELTTNQREALRLLGVYTAGRFDFWLLAGSAKASCRAHIMSMLNGIKTPQSKSGVNAMRDVFIALAEIAPACSARQDDEFAQWATAQTKKDQPLDAPHLDR